MRAARGAIDPADLEQLDRNIREAGRLFKSVGGFESQLRALAGVRGALRARIDAIMAPDTIEVPIAVTDAGGHPIGEPDTARSPVTATVTVPEYFKSVPRHLWDVALYAVQREVHLRLGAAPAIPETVRVFDKATGDLVWSSDGSGDRVA